MKALDEIERLFTKSINNNPSIWDKTAQYDVTKVSFLNSRSLVNKFDNIKMDLSLQQSDVIVLAETWIPERDRHTNKFELDNYESHFNNQGRGKGLAVYHKQDFGHMNDVNEENVSITKIGSEEMEIISIYQSKEPSAS